MMQRSRIAWNTGAPRGRMPRARWLLRLVGALVLALTLGLVASAGHARAVSPAVSGSLYFVQPVTRGLIGGPPGARVEVDGTSWVPYSTVTLSLTNSGSCGSGSVGTFQTNPNGAFTAGFLWPLAVNQVGTYHVCGTQAGNGSTLSLDTFSLLASSPPTLTFSPSSLVAGDVLTIAGANWVPGPQTLTLAVVPCASSCTAAPIATQTIVTNNDGTFSQQLTISASAPSGKYYVQAANSTATLSVAPAGPIQVSGQDTSSGTPVPGTSPTTTATRISQGSTGVPTTSSPVSQASSALKNALLAAGLGLVALLVLIGGLAFLIGRSRGPDMPARAKPAKDNEPPKPPSAPGRQAPWRTANAVGAAAPPPGRALALHQTHQRQEEPADNAPLPPADEELAASQNDDDVYPPEEQIPPPPPDPEEMDQGRRNPSSSGHLHDRSARYLPARRFPRPGSSGDQWEQ